VCGRYVLDETVDLSERFRVVRQSLPGFAPTWNAAPTQSLPVVLADGDGTSERVAEVMRWGLVLPWAGRGGAGGRAAPSPFNARAETVAERPAFRRLIARRRCLVPATGFYEWAKRPGGGKRPIFFSLRDGDPFAFAGIYDRARDEAGREVASYAILTTRPNTLVAEAHDRMPVILRPEDEDDWLDPELTDPPALERLYEPYPAGKMTARPVGTAVNDARRDGPDLILPAEGAVPTPDAAPRDSA
jgi:putative SOS response-associated peptidase YedK